MYTVLNKHSVFGVSNSVLIVGTKSTLASTELTQRPRKLLSYEDLSPRMKLISISAPITQ